MKTLQKTTVILFLIFNTSLLITKAQDIDKAFKYFKAEQYEKAALEFEGALPDIEKAYGKQDTSYYSKLLLYTSFNFQAYLNYKKAEQYYIKCNTVYKSINALFNPYYATSCNNLAALYDAMGNYQKAEPLYLEAKKIREKILGKEHPDYATSCNNLASLYQSMGNYQKAEPLYLEAKEIRQKVLGKEHPDYAASCNNLAGLYQSMGNYQKAEPLYIEAKKIREKVLGKEHLDYATSCNNLALLYQSMGNYKKAEPLYIEAKKIDAKILGKEHPSYATDCNNLAGLYKSMGNYSKAEPLYIEAKKIKEKVLGKEHPSYATSCNNLAGLYESIGNYKKAEPLYLEAKEIRQKVFVKEHPDYASSCGNLAGLYDNMGNYPKAEPLYVEAKKIIGKVLGKEHPNYATSCNNLAALYAAMGNYKKAEPLYLEAKKIYENILGKEHPHYAQSCNNLASLYQSMGNYQKAEPLYLEAKEIRQKVLGKEHPSYAASCNNLAGLYNDMGNYQKAEPLYLEAKKIREKVLGKEHPSYAASCNNLAGLYNDMGNYQKAEPLYLEAKKINAKIFGKEHPSYATDCNNLASLYKSMGNYKKAEPLYLEAKKIYGKVLGKEHPDYAQSCNNLAGLYYAMGNYKKAEPLFLETKNIIEKVSGKNHPHYASSCNNLAGLYRAKGNYKKAETLYLEAKKIYEKVLGKEHPHYALSCNNLAGLYESIGNYQKAEPLYVEANTIMHKLSEKSAKFMSEKEREKYLTKKINYNFEVYHSFFLTRRKENKKLTGIVYNNALSNKGQLLRSATAMRKAVLQSGDTALINTYTKMNEIGQMLNKEYTKPIAKRRPDIKQLEEKSNTLEKELVRRTQDLSGFQNLTGLKTDWKAVKKSLKKNETAVEFIHFDYRNDKEWTDSTLYYALVLRKNYKYPKAVFLFEEKQLQKLTNREFGATDFEQIKKLYGKKSPQADSLYNLVWKPLEKYTKPSSFRKRKVLPTVYISPSGMLNSISFDALVIDTASILSDKYYIKYTSTTAQAINKTGLYKKNLTHEVLFGGLYYDLDIEKMKENSSGYTFEPYTRSYTVLPDSKVRGKMTWSYLDGTFKEVKAIEKILSGSKIKTKLYTEDKGNEEVFKSMEKNAPDIIHISTHGFFFPEPETKREDNSSFDNDKKLQFTDSENPLLRSGLLLSGAQNAFSGNKLPKGMEDGVLTASEISKMNLFNTKLVVLSACQSGLGDVKGNEGVYGMQRAFKMSGVDYLIYSLWEVPDKQTKELMQSFYKNLLSGMEIRKAFKKSQNYMKKKYEGVKGASYAWAAFVLMK